MCIGVNQLFTSLHLAPDKDKPDSAEARQVRQHYTAFDPIYPVSTGRQPWPKAPQHGGCLFSSKHRQRTQTICIHTSVSAQSALLKILRLTPLTSKMHSHMARKWLTRLIYARCLALRLFCRDELTLSPPKTCHQEGRGLVAATGGLWTIQVYTCFPCVQKNLQRLLL